jgi:hypothetical protein
VPCRSFESVGLKDPVLAQLDEMSARSRVTRRELAQKLVQTMDVTRSAEEELQSKYSNLRGIRGDKLLVRCFCLGAVIWVLTIPEVFCVWLALDVTVVVLDHCDRAVYPRRPHVSVRLSCSRARISSTNVTTACLPLARGTCSSILITTLSNRLCTCMSLIHASYAGLRWIFHRLQPGPSPLSLSPWSAAV